MKELKIVLNTMSSPSFILIGTVAILLVARYVFRLKYINCFDIIKSHINCFRKENGEMDIIAVMVYLGVPCLLAIAVMKIRLIDSDTINIVTIIISILTSMFFTLLTLIIDMREKVRVNPDYNANDAFISSKLLKETYYSIMFEILISIIVLIMCFVELFAEKFCEIESFIIYFLTFTMLINLFMILKRIYKVINKNMEN